MNIVHISMASSYTENMSYQDNLLSNQNALDGHNVTVISNCRKISCGKEIYAEPEDRVMGSGVRLIRLEYDKVLNSYISQKVRKVKKLYPLLEELKPDVILFHGLSGWELLSATKYKKRHPNIKMYVDNHADVNNSATNFISNFFLHRVFYRTIVQNSLSYIDKVFYLSYECGDFLELMYHVPKEQMEFYPLGGVIFPGNEKQTKRKKIRKNLGLNDENVLCIHSGKMDMLKRTFDILRAFSQVKSEVLRLVLIGSMTEDVGKDVELLINSDSRISFVGWKTADELMEYLCAADMYLQPGSQSATMQNAICCGCPLMLYPHRSHKPYLQGNGFYVKTVDDMAECFRKIESNSEILKEMSMASYEVAHELLDYKKLAARLYI